MLSNKDKKRDYDSTRAQGYSQNQSNTNRG